MMITLSSSMSAAVFARILLPSGSARCSYLDSLVQADSTTELLIVTARLLYGLSTHSERLVPSAGLRGDRIELCIALRDKTKIVVLRWSLSLSLLFYLRTPVNATRRPTPLRKLQYAVYRIIHDILVLLTIVVYYRLIICVTVYRSHW